MHSAYMYPSSGKEIKIVKHAKRKEKRKKKVKEKIKFHFIQ